MRIACVNQDPGVTPGRKKGAAIHLAAMRSAFAELECDVHTFDGCGDDVERELEAQHMRGAIDLVYERQSLGGTAAARFCRRRDVPLFLEVNAPLIEEARAHRGFEPTPRDRDDEAFVLSTAAELFPVSSPLAALLRERGVPHQRLHVTPNGVDTRHFRPRVRSIPDLDLPGDAFVLGFHGRLRPWHNFELFVQAFGLLVQRGYPVHMLAVGEGDFDAHLPAELRARATIRGWMEADELAAHVACFHVLPLTYAPDAPCYFSPLKLLEAMACGVVGVVPELGDLPKVVEFGRAGVVVPAGDSRALADAVAGLIEWPEARERLSRIAVARAEQRSWTAVAREILGFFRGARVR